jgi:hypothetical protein
MVKRVPLGELLVNAGFVSPSELDAALQEQLGSDLRLGVILARRGLVSETQVTQILSRQLSVPWVSLHHITFPPELLGRVPSELARRHRLVPVYVRRVRRVGEILYLAMDDPEDDHGLSEVEQYAGLAVKPMIASPSDITRALVEYYGLPPPPLDAPPMNHRAPTKRRESADAPDRPSLALHVQLILADGSTVHIPIPGLADPCATLLDALQSRHVISGWCFSGSA